MKSVAWLAVALLPWLACASGQTGDGIDGRTVDAPAVAVDGAALDAPALDAAVDAPTDAGTDATPIDATPTDAPPTDAATDAPPTDAPPTDAATDAPSTGPVDTCAQARDITTGALTPAGITLTGDLTGYANDIQPASSCTGFTNDGPDAVYAVTLPTAGRIITASVTAAWDSAVEIVQPCGLTPTCLIGQDNGDPEAVTYTTVAAGTFYVIVDSWDPGSFGPYTLTVRVQ